MALALPLSRIGESVDESDSSQNSPSCVHPRFGPGGLQGIIKLCDRLRKVGELVPVRTVRQEPPPRATCGPEPRAVRPRQGQCRTGELYSGQATRNVGGARCTKELALFREGGILVLLVKVVVVLRLATDAVQS